MHDDSPADSKLRSGLLKNLIRITLRIIGAGVVLIFGLWFIMASNMGPAYLPHIMDGALDFWIRISLLGVGIGIWISIVVWLARLILCYFYELVRPNL